MTLDCRLELRKHTIQVLARSCDMLRIASKSALVRPKVQDGVGLGCPGKSWDAPCYLVVSSLVSNTPEVGLIGPSQGPENG